jgi:hypothetical protein
MKTKPYHTPENEPGLVSEPAVAYPCRDAACHVSTNRWNPNIPFHGTQDEWWEHFHRIEEGEFNPVTEVHQRISKWLYNQQK